MSEHVRGFILKDYQKKMNEMTGQNFYVYTVQVIAFILLVFALAFHVAEVGLIGVGLIVLVTAFTGLTKEHDIGGAFVNAMPFAVLIVVFFAILGVVHSQHLVTPLAEWVFRFEDPKAKLLALYLTNGSLSFVSDNVFIATVFITEVETAFVNGVIAQMLGTVDFSVQNIQSACANGSLHYAVTQYLDTIPNYRVGHENEIIAEFIRTANAHYREGIGAGGGELSAFNAYIADCASKPFISREEVERLAVVVNMGTNIPAMATPNGHAALLFLLTSSLAPLLKLSYLKMIELTLPYTIVMATTGALAIYFFV
jgi:NhaB family Na+:H+ antiporter